MLWWLRLVSVFAVVGIASDIIQREPGTLTRHPNNLIVLAGLVVAIVSLLQYRDRMTTDLRILAGGLLVFGLFSINDNLVSMGLLPWDWREESIGFLIFIGCLFSIAVRHFFSTERELATVEGELEAARRIQNSILPDGPPKVAGISIAIRFQPSSTVAGDFYDFLDPDSSHVGMVVADVSGHGVPAALIASMVKIAVVSRVDCIDRPARLLSEVNRTLAGNFRHGFVTAAFVFLDSESSEMVIASAGHPQPLLLSTKTGSLREVGGTGTVLGRFDDAVFHEVRYPFNPGDRLVLYTDGIVEARDSAAEMFGEERLRSVIGTSTNLCADELAERLIGEVRTWTQSQSNDTEDDDLTLIVVDRVSTD